MAGGQSDLPQFPGAGQGLGLTTAATISIKVASTACSPPSEPASKCADEIDKKRSRTGIAAACAPPNSAPNVFASAPALLKAAARALSAPDYKSSAGTGRSMVPTLSSPRAAASSAVAPGTARLNEPKFAQHHIDREPQASTQCRTLIPGPVRLTVRQIQCLGRRAGRRIVQGAGVVWTGDNAPSGQGGSARWGGQRSSCAGGWQLHGARQAWRGPGRPAGQRGGGAGGSAEEQGDGLVRVQAQLRHAPFDIRRFQQP